MRRIPAPLVLAVVLPVFAAGCARVTHGSREPGVIPVVARPGRPANPWSDLTRDVLVQRCGQCHRGDLATANPRALLVFNLIENPWWSRLSGEQLDELLERVSGIHDLPSEDVSTVAKFVRCARAGECDAAEGGP